MTAGDQDRLPPAARLSELARRFDVFLVDQFGVLTDGVRLYPGALDALRALRAAGRRVALLSNSGRRASLNAERLAAMGIPARRLRPVHEFGRVRAPSAAGARTCGHGATLPAALAWRRRLAA